jgi:hypothetical protein
MIAVEDEPQGVNEPQGDDDTKPQGDPKPQGDKQSAADWQQLARKWEARAKKDADNLAKLQAQVKTLVAPETVADKDRAIAEAQAEAKAARLDALRYRIAVEEQLPASMAARLLGEDEDALRADAKELVAALAPKPPRRTDAGKGTGDNGGPPRTTDANTLLRQIVGGG